MNRLAVAALAIVGFGGLLLAAVFWVGPRIEKDLKAQTEKELNLAGIETGEDKTTIEFDGRTGTIEGKQAAIAFDRVKDIPGARWNDVAELPPTPTVKMTRLDPRNVSFEGSVGSEEQKIALFDAAEAAGQDVEDQLLVDEDIELNVVNIKPLVTPLLSGSENGIFELENGVVTVTAEAKDPVEAEAIDAAVVSIENSNWKVVSNLTVVELSEKVQITKLQEEIDQIFELARNIEGESPNFESSENELNPAAKEILDRVTVALRRYPLPAAEIIGHSDSVGSSETNQKLSENRAFAVSGYLVDNGVEQARLTVRGVGEDEPLNPNSTQAGRKENRRVNFIVKSRK